MLPENANPDLPEKQEEETPQVEQDSTQSETQENTPEITETAAEELQSPAEEEIQEESDSPSEIQEDITPVAEVPESDPGNELVNEVEEVESSSQEKPETDDAAQTIDAGVETESVPDNNEAETQNQETLSESVDTPETSDTPAEEAESTEGESDSQEEEKEEPAPKIVLPPLNQDLLPKIEELISDKEKKGQILVDATTSDLLQLMESYSKEENIARFVAKVGLVKRSYDARKYKEESDKEISNRFHAALAEFNKKRAAHQVNAEAEKKNNSARKKELLQKLQTVVAAEDANLIQEVREIQDEWKGIGHVLREDIEPLYKAYRYQLDKFYKLREMHFELLDYDRKINLQEKEKLIKEAEKLIPPEEDREKTEVWKEKNDMLAELRQQWKAIGHVPREDLERINNEYRAVVDRFFEVRQGFMESQDQLRTEFGDKKKEILEKMQVFKTFHSEKPRDWNDATRGLREYQEAWNQLGQAPHSINGELWSKYREVCNSFFSKKSEFFKGLDQVRAENLAKKRLLVEQVEALKESTEMEKAANEIKRLQKEWKTIGPVPERHSNKIWNRFRSACDSFFEKRREKYQSQNSDEKVNLVAKKALIEEVNKLEVDKNNVGASIEVIKSLQAKWKTIGKVPYKEKDKIWEEFRGAIDSFFDGLSLKRGELRELRLKSSIESITDDDERTQNVRGKVARIRRKIAQSQEKVDQYSINVQYIAKGKSGDTLRQRIEGDIEKEKKLIVDLKNQIKVLNDALKAPPKAPVAEPVAESKETAAPVEEAKAEVASEEKKEAEGTEDKPVEEVVAEVAAPATEEAPAKEETPASSAEEGEAPESKEVAAPEETREEVTTPAAEEVVPDNEAPAVDEDQSV